MNRKWVVTMSVKICGHRVRCEKPIKIYTLLKTSCFVLMICALAVSPVFAGERPLLQKISTGNQASTGAAVPCLPLSKSGMSVPATQKTDLHRTQRSAGTPSAPALALALALGLRNVPGPVETNKAAQARNKATAPGSQQAFLLPGDGTCKYKTFILDKHEKLAMER